MEIKGKEMQPEGLEQRLFDPRGKFQPTHVELPAAAPFLLAPCPSGLILGSLCIADVPAAERRGARSPHTGQMPRVRGEGASALQHDTRHQAHRLPQLLPLEPTPLDNTGTCIISIFKKIQ